LFLCRKGIEETVEKWYALENVGLRRRLWNIERLTFRS
jgi:hypothetical protein